MILQFMIMNGGISITSIGGRIVLRMFNFQKSNKTSGKIAFTKYGLDIEAMNICS